LSCGDGSPGRRRGRLAATRGDPSELGCGEGNMTNGVHRMRIVFKGVAFYRCVLREGGGGFTVADGGAGLCTQAGEARPERAMQSATAVVALEDLAFVGNVAHHPRQELQSVHGLRPRGGAARLVGLIGVTAPVSARYASRLSATGCRAQ